MAMERRDEQDDRVSRYWEMEAQKMRMSNEELEIVVSSPFTKGSVVDAIIDYCATVSPALVVLASVELIKTQKGSAPLGSVAQAVAMRTPAHVCITKNVRARVCLPPQPRTGAPCVAHRHNLPCLSTLAEHQFSAI